MAETHLAILVDAAPQRPLPERSWLADGLAEAWRHLPAPGSPDVVRAWAVGSVIDNETLVQTRPRVRNGSHGFLDDLLRANARCTIAAYAVAAEGEPLSPVEIVRHARWVATAIVPEPPSPATLAALGALTPDFLQRTRVSGGPLEAVGLAVFGALHRLGALSGAFPAPRLVRAALAEVLERLEPVDGTMLAVQDGRNLAIAHVGPPIRVARAPQPEPTARVGVRRERRVLLVASGALAGDPLPAPLCSLDPATFDFVAS